jgi:hypothetical protein
MRPAKLATLLVLLILCFAATAQNTTDEHLDTLVSNFSFELRAKGIDQICIYKDYFIGGYYTTKDEEDLCRCIIYIPTYIFWKERGKTYVCKKDNCWDYSIVEINAADTLWNYFSNYRDSIKNEEVKPFQYEKSEKATDSTSEKVIGEIWRDHSGHQEFKMMLANDKVTKHFDSFFLEEKDVLFDKTEYNINYEHNIFLKSKRVIDILNNLARQAEDSKLLIRTRR